MKILREDMELQRKQEIHEIEERKNNHINELMKQHERAFAEIKNYYNDITHNNLDLIKTLKEDVSEMKKREAQNEKLMYEIAQVRPSASIPAKCHASGQMRCDTLFPAASLTLLTLVHGCPFRLTIFRRSAGRCYHCLQSSTTAILNRRSS